MGIRRSADALVFVLVATATTVATFATAALPAAADDAVFYRPPVDAPVVDPFRAPRSAFGAGNRGLTYAPASGTGVTASAPGQVTFAGFVAGAQHVTVLHADGLRTSYSFLESVAVRRGEVVGVGETVGHAGAGFHFGVRDGDRYLDPASIFGVVEVRVRLVGHDEDLPPTDEGLLQERIALAEVVEDKGLLDRLKDAGRYLLSAELGGLHMFEELDPKNILTGGLAALWDRAWEDCTGDGVALPGAPGAGHVGLLVAGHGSSSGPAGVDDVETTALGYDPDDVLRYSYAGGRIPDDDLAADLATIEATEYDAGHTRADLVAEGVALADLVESIAAARPGVPIDLIAHSQGGIVTRTALEELEERGRLDVVGTVVTIGTPHRGTDLSTAALLFSQERRRTVGRVAGLVGVDIDSGAESVLQMAEFSELTRRLADEGIPDGVSFRTIGAAGDPVVTGDKTTVDGVASAMVSLYGPRAHGHLPGDPGTTREIGLALAGMDPGCRDVGESLIDAFVPEGLSWAENRVLSGLVIGG